MSTDTTDTMNEDSIADDWAQALEEQASSGATVDAAPAFDALAGEPMDVLVNGYLIAQGEVVVVNDKFGIRLTDIVTPSERMRRLSKG